MKLAIAVLAALPLAAQQTPLFPVVSITSSSGAAEFETSIRVDPGDGLTEGTVIGLEDDLGLDSSRTLQRFTIEWRPLARHELAASWFSASRDGLQQIDREIVFRDEVYPVQALVATGLDLDYRSVAYTYWVRRTERNGVGITLGAAAISIDAAITAERPDISVTISESADTDVPVALAGIQGRIALSRTVHALLNASALPRLTIEDYTGSAAVAVAAVEWRPVRWLGVGGAYHYFRLDIDVAQAELRGALDMTVRGPEAYLRLAF